MGTKNKFDLICSEIENIFVLKNKDYGMSWLVFRPITFADQMLMKILRIIKYQNGGILQVDDNIRNDWIAIANYSIFAIIRKEEENIKSAKIEAVYKEKVLDIKTLFQQKNSDYNESWKKMEIETITDLIYAKIMRIKHIIKHDEKLVISEDIASNYRDIYMYVVLTLIKLDL